ncbi:MAG TPA: putative peptidoglycan glycosyltransferase FtsW [Candidatus Saccharimonadales bacterium]|nr:putative peptidoglycan glycosyltransferase FtsW [Candidatus Saccharimonadales bacterium]
MQPSVRRRPLSLQPLGTRRHRPDYWLLLLSAMLLAIGVIVVYSISPALAVDRDTDGSFYVTRQLIAVGLGIVAFGITAAIPLESWRQLWKPLLVLAAVVTVVALFMPANPQYPAHRWIRLGSLSFQSVELLKFALLIAISAFLAERVKNGTLQNVKETLKPLLIGLVGIGVAVAWQQSDFGSMMVIVVMASAMVFVAGLPMKRLLLIVMALVVVAALAISAVPYRRDRIAAFLHQGDTTNCVTLVTGYQACQALVAIGSGGIMGLGLGRSVQAFGYLPEAENDSIFAIYAEKFGFIGGIALLGLLLALLTRLKRIMERTPDDFSRLIVTGVFTWFAVQAMINIGAMIGLLPLKGITLPFISYGGTSVLFVMAAIGLVFQISRYTLYSVPEASSVNGGGGYDNRSDRRRVRGAYHPNPGRRA